MHLSICHNPKQCALWPGTLRNAWKKVAQAGEELPKLLRKEIQMKRVKRTKNWPLQRGHLVFRWQVQNLCIRHSWFSQCCTSPPHFWKLVVSDRITNNVFFGHRPGTDLNSIHVVFLTFMALWSLLICCCCLLTVSSQFSKLKTDWSCNHKWQPRFCNWTTPSQSSLCLVHPSKGCKFLTLLPRNFLKSNEVVPYLSLPLVHKEILFQGFSYSKHISKMQRWSFSYLICIDGPMQTLKANSSLFCVSITFTYKSMGDDLGIWDLAAWKTSHLRFRRQTMCVDSHMSYRRESNNDENISEEPDWWRCQWQAELNTDLCAPKRQDHISH